MKWMRRLGWAVAALLLLWAVAWLLVPPIVKTQAERQLSERLGRTVTLGSVDFSPWALRLTLSDLAMASAPGASASAPQFSLARLEVDVDARSLLRLAPVVESLQVDAPKLRLARTADGHYDIDDVLQRLAPRPGDPPGEAPRFAVYNVAVRDGELLFDDRPVQRQHRLSALQLSLPFLSNLPSQVDIQVEPRLSFVFDGAAFDTGAQALPFAETRSGKLNLRVAALDLDPYLGYLPESLPVRLQRGRVESDLTVDFAAPPQGPATVSLRGRVGLSDRAVAERGGAPLLELGRLSLGLDDVQPLARRLAFGALKLDGLVLHLARDDRGALSIERLRGGAAPAAPAASPTAGSAPGATSAGSSAGPWQLSLTAVELDGGRVLWNDAAVQPASDWALDGLTASAQQVQFPLSRPMPFALRATLRPQSEGATTLGVLSVQGEGSETAATARFELSALSLAAVAPYVNAAARVRVAGTGAATGQVDWAPRTDAAPMRLLVAIEQFTLDGLKADERAAATARGETLAARRVQLGKVALDLAAQSVSIGSAKIQQPQLHLERGADGVWNVMRLAGPTPLEESARPLVRAAAEATWQVRLDDFALDGGRVDFVDALPSPPREGAAPVAPVRLGIDGLRLGLRDLRLRGEKLVSTPQVQLSARVIDQGTRGARETPGSIDWRGRIGLQPLLVAGKARIERFPVDAVQAYAPHPLGVRIDRAEAGFQGDVMLRQVDASGVQLDATGDVLMSDLRLLSIARPGSPKMSPEDRELLSWQSFAINGLAVAVRPGVVPRVAVREATLSDFFARLVLTEEGELNLRDVAPPRPAAAASAAGAASAPASPLAPVAVAVVAAPASAASAPARVPFGGTSLPVDLDLGGLRLVNGRVDFSDRFVKPNYSAALTELNGNVGAFRSGVGEAASLRLSGRVAGTGLLAIEGRLKPNAVPRELDVTAKATDIELAPLSTYAGKYAGYAIERGKLSVEVRYKIDPDGKLEASHQLVLNQLTFGERVESPTATKLPVLFAVSLLKDSNGVIDINLPVSGTLDDPQFSLGPIIWKVILNLLGKIVTAPFSLLAGGGGPDLSVVAFDPGTAQPAASAAATFDKVAKALNDRPALKMTVVGEADPDVEREAYQRAVVEQKIVDEQRREQLRASGAASAPEATAAAPPLAPDERARLVKAVYRETDLPDKPRNMIGLKADIAPDEMEALLRSNVKASPEAMRALALQRGLAVRDALIAKGLASERLFLGEPKLHVGGTEWSPQVKLTLDTK